MKKKSIVIITFCMAIALCVAGIGVAFAWYTSNAGADNRLELSADGYLVIYFDRNEYTLDEIKPAVAKTGAIADNVTEFDVVYGDDNIVTTATVIEHEGMFRYLDQGEGNATEAEISVVCEAYLTFADGQQEKLSLKYDLSVEVDISWVYLDRANVSEQQTFSISNDAWQTADTNNAETKFDLDGSADLTINSAVYLRQPDELCNPRIREAEKIQVVIMIGATPIGGSGNA